MTARTERLRDGILGPRIARAAALLGTTARIEWGLTYLPLSSDGSVVAA